jgi:hypothetical protein
MNSATIKLYLKLLEGRFSSRLGARKWLLRWYTPISVEIVCVEHAIVLVEYEIVF